MSREYVKKNLEKIYSESGHEYPQNLALSAAWIMANLKGTNIKIYNTIGKSTLADHYLLVSCNNKSQAQSMAEEIIYYLKPFNIRPISIEGIEEAEWILLDLGDIIIHIFQDFSRDIINLDALWNHLPLLQLPEDYYISANTPTVEKFTTDDKLSYF